MRTRLLPLAILCLTATLAAGEGASRLSPTALFVVSLVNFGLFLFVLVKLGGPAVVSFFADRERAIRETFESYRAEYERTEERIAALRRAIEDLPAEKERILASYRRRAEEQYAALVDEAQRHGEFLRRDAERVSRDEALDRRAEIIAAFADRLTADLAERARSLDPSQRRALARSFGEFSREARHE